MRALLLAAVNPAGPDAAAVRSEVDAVDGGAVSGNNSEWTWRTQVHALNILRLIFRDASLGEHTPLYGGPGIRVAVAGFSSRAWAVRNSSMMLFAAVAERAVGSPSKLRSNLTALEAMRARGSGSGSVGETGATTTAQFFGRYPLLYPFLLQQLNGAVSASVNPGAGEEAASPRALFPLLLLLTRLVCAHDGVAHDPAAFLPAFIACRASPNAFIRRLAGAAMATAASPSTALSVMAATLQALATPSANELHGICLQLEALAVVDAARTRAPEDFGDAVEAGITGPLLASVQRAGVALITASYLRVLRAWRVTRPGLGGDHTELALALAQETVQPMGATPLAASLGRPLLLVVSCELLVRATVAALVSSAGAGAGAMASLARLIASPEQEVRLPAAKAFKRWLKHADELVVGGGVRDGKAMAGRVDMACRTLQVLFTSPPSPGPALVALLLARQGAEEGPEALRYVSHALSLLLAAGGAGAALDEPHLAAALRAHDALSEPTARSHALRVIGMLASAQVAAHPASAAPFVQAVSIRIADGATHARSLPLRIACGSAIREGGLLALALRPSTCTTPLALSRAALPAVAAVLALSEDGDDEVREVARAAVAAAAAAWVAAGEGGEGALRAACDRIVGRCAEALRPLLPPARLLPSPPDAVGPFLPPSPALRALYVDEGRAGLLLHALLLEGAEGALGAGEDGEGLAAGLLALLSTRVGRVLAGAPARFQALRQQEEVQMPGAAGGYSLDLLSRPLFTADDENQHAEPLVSGGLAVAVLRLVEDGLEEEGPAAARLGRVLGRAAEASHAGGLGLLRSAMLICESASAVDVGTLSVPLLLEAGPWLPLNGADDCPHFHLFAASKLAEALLG